MNDNRSLSLNRIAIGSIILVAVLLGYGYLKTTYFMLQEPVADVNGEVITTKEFQERVRLERVRELNMLQTYSYYQQAFGMDTSQQQQQIQATLSTPTILGQQVLDMMTDELVIRQEAKKLGITVSEEEVNKSIQEAYGFFPSGTFTPTVTSTAFTFPTMSSEQLTLYPSTATPTTAPTSTVAPTNTPDAAATATATATASVATPTFVPEAATATATPYTIEGFNSEYDKTVTQLKAYNISEETLRKVYEMQLIRQKLLEQVTTDVPHSEEKVWARHILLDDATKAEAARNLLLQGGRFCQACTGTIERYRFRRERRRSRLVW
ncbi:MAG: SurA N-terminal domain-containing protein [Anaerolineales bacterium]